MSSAGAVSLDYESDMRLIFQKEIYPYTRFPKRARRWLKKLGKRILNLIEKYVGLERKIGKTMFGKAALGAWYYAHHPIQAVRKLRP